MKLIFTIILYFIAISYIKGQINPSDACPGALLSVNTNCVTNNYTLSGTFANAGLISASCATSGQDRDDGWYQFVATSTTTVVDATANRNYLIAAWTACAGGSELACDIQASTPASITFSTTPGTTYFIQIHRRGGNNGANMSGTICIHEPVAGGGNDDPCGATSLTVGTSCSFSTFSNATATASAGVPAPGCASYSGGDVWFSVVVPANGNITLDMNTGVITDAGMAVYSGTCGALSLVQCDDDDSANGLMSMIALSGQTPGAILFVRVWEFGNNNNGTFDICAFDPGGSSGGGGTGIIPTACATQTFNITANTNFYDDGGQGGQPCTDGHAANFCNCNCETTSTICAPAGFTVQVDFSVFAMFNTNSAFDWMKIYDGAGLGGTVLFDNDLGGPDNAPNGGSGTGYGDCGDDAPPVGFCSSSECLTFEFHASGVVNRSGWEAAVTLRGTGCTVLLPVSTTDFNVFNNNGLVEISWETNMEINNDYFTIERSQDAHNWEDFIKVDADGNSISPLFYKEFDDNPYNGYTYYRLRQTDISGLNSYSQVKVVSFDDKTAAVLTVFPNPASSQITITGSEIELSSLSVFNTLGQNVTSSVVFVNRNGINLILDLSNLGTGIYTLKTPNAVRKIQKN
jgi:hypothetical protein